LYIGETKIHSVGENYDQWQADLVFELHKDKTITYFFKSENGLTQQTENDEIKRVEKKEAGYEGVNKLYTKGYWDVNFEDKTILIHFDERNVPELRFTYSDLGNGFVNFQQISYYDSVYKGETVRIKQINSMYYGRLFHRF